MLRVLFWLLVLVSLAGCAIAVPVHEGEPPEVLGNWGFRVALLEGTAPMLATPPTNGTADGSIATPLVGFRFGVGFLDRFQLNVDSFAGISSGGSAFSLKYQWKGDTYFKAEKGNTVQTSVVRIWNGAAANFSLDPTFSYPYGDIEGSGEDIAHLFGFRPTSWFGLYGGPKITAGRVTANYKTTSGGAVVATNDRGFFGGGAVGGLFLSPHGRHIGFDLNLEGEIMNLPETYSNNRMWYSTIMVTLGLPFSFGS